MLIILIDVDECQLYKTPCDCVLLMGMLTVCVSAMDFLLLLAWLAPYWYIRGGFLGDIMGGGCGPGGAGGRV